MDTDKPLIIYVHLCSSVALLFHLRKGTMKIFTSLFGTETNTFSPFLTGFQNFEQTYLVRNGAHGDEPSTFAVPLVRWREMAHARGWKVAEGLATFAMPAGTTLRSVYESFRDEMLDELRAAMPVDGVLLMMHGAMVAQGYDDCEGDVTARVREIVGPDVPIGVELDLHCHLTDTLIDNADAVITFKEYPHTDPPERAEELFAVIADAMEGKTKPITSMVDCHDDRRLSHVASTCPRLRRQDDHAGAAG